VIEMAEKLVRVINRLPQRLPVVTKEEKTGKLVHGFLPPSGSKTMKASELSEQLKGLAKKKHIEIVEL
jgi:hypothetical protein